MQLQEFHIRTAQKGANWVDAVAAVSGFERTLAPAWSAVENKLSPLGISVPMVFGLRNEVLLSPDGTRGLACRTWDVRHEPRQEVAEFLAIGTFGRGEVEAILQEAAGPEAGVFRGSRVLDAEVASLEKKLGNASPNGKKLGDPTIRTALEKLSDDDLRAAVRNVTQTFGQNCVPDSLLSPESLFPDRSADEMPHLLACTSNPAAFEEQWLVMCPKCDQSHLSFSERLTADQALQGGTTCGSCGSATLTVQGARRVRPEFASGVTQGLWLEALVADVIRPHASHLWEGQMVGTNEIDVLALCPGGLLLAECKDTSFGQNDLYVTAMKAQSLGADRVLVVTTNELHDNVKQAAAQIARDTPGRRPMKFVQADRAAVIREQVHGYLEDLTTQFARSWLLTDDRPTRYYAYG